MFCNVSSDSNYNSEFLELKTQFEVEHHDYLNECGNNIGIINTDFTITELNDCLGQTKNTSPGQDNISYILLRKLPIAVKLMLLQFFNLIWNIQQLPQSWKHAIVVPVYKTNKNKFDPLSYRPIALTSTLCKIMERMVNNRLRWFLEINDIYSVVIPEYS